MAEKDGKKKHRGNTGNLKPPWKPGESGNPKGRPEGATSSFRTVLRRRLEAEAPAAVLEAVGQRGFGVGKDKTGADVVVAYLTDLMEHPDPDIRQKAITLIAKHADPPEVQKIAPTSPDGEEPYAENTAQEILELVKRLTNGKGNGKGEK